MNTYQIFNMETKNMNGKISTKKSGINGFSPYIIFVSDIGGEI
jgi:hypothetical protein